MGLGLLPVSKNIDGVLCSITSFVVGLSNGVTTDWQFQIIISMIKQTVV